MKAIISVYLWRNAHDGKGGEHGEPLECSPVWAVAHVKCEYVSIVTETFLPTKLGDMGDMDLP